MNAMGLLGGVLSLAAGSLNAKHRRLAQIVYIFGNSLWIIYALSTHAPEVLLFQVLYLILGIRTLRAWLCEGTQRGNSVIVKVEP